MVVEHNYATLEIHWDRAALTIVTHNATSGAVLDRRSLYLAELQFAPERVNASEANQAACWPPQSLLRWRDLTPLQLFHRIALATVAASALLFALAVVSLPSSWRRYRAAATTPTTTVTTMPMTTNTRDAKDGAKRSKVD